MNPGVRVNGFIEDYTGISNSMLKNASSCEIVMDKFYRFISNSNLVAHNASFDSKFLEAEFERINRPMNEEFACSMLIARRMYQDAPNHKLGTLVSYKQLPNDGTFHRALADSQMTAHLWLAMIDDIKTRHSLKSVPFDLMQKLSRTPKHAVSKFLSAYSSSLR